MPPRSSAPTLPSPNETAWSSPTAEPVSSLLRHCRDRVRPALRQELASIGPELRPMLAYALGLAEGDCPEREGKRIRSTLTLLAARAVGGQETAALPGAVAVELVHTFSLAHDDVMDGDERRRDRPPLWRAYGMGPAVLAGDALLALAVDTVCRVPGRTGELAMASLSTALSALAAGQAADLEFERRPWTGPDAVTVERYLRMAAGKTGSLFGCATALGAGLNGAPEPWTRALHQAGERLGLAFQAVDDLLGIWGDPRTTGKPVFGDLRNRKKTLPVLAALRSAPQLADRLAQLPDDGDGSELAETAAAIEAAGGRRATVAFARRQLDRAGAALDLPGLDHQATVQLLGLGEHLVSRTS